MPATYLALVADDQHVAAAIQVHLERALGETAFLCRLASIRQHLGPKSEGLLLLAAASAADAEQIVQLVRAVRVQQWPPVLFIVEAQAAAEPSPATGQPALAVLDPYVEGRFRWPSEASKLLDALKAAVGRQRRFTPVEDESLEERIGRRLLTQIPSLQLLAEPLALAASHDVTVLLSGETGTGKTYLAQLIHEFSPRREQQLLVVPCGALVANLVESELFGHVKGAFTGADRAKVGKFEAVGTGTLLLDEIDALGLEQQTNLLRVIETGEYEPVGSNETKFCHARIIVASNWNLEEAVEQGKFRQDLFYRLNVMSFYLPPLRERVQDIGPLVRAMVVRFNGKFHKSIFAISAEAMTALEAFPWPGNIRQLENVVQQAVLLSNGPELLLQHLPKPVREQMLQGPAGAAGNDSLVYNRQALERSVIQRALVSAGYNRARAASALGISRVTLYKKMKKYGLMDLPLRSANVS